MGNEIPLDDRFRGCLLGLALRDARGAPHEGGPIERLVWRAIGRTKDGKRRWTDDTQMSIDVAESLIANRGIAQDDLAERFAKSYRWSRGYGPGTAKLMKRIRRGADWRTANRSVYPNGSYGNGAAMRAPVVAMFAGPDSAEALERAVVAVSEITHSHPQGIQGALAIAVATTAALQGQGGRDLLKSAADAMSDDGYRQRAATALRLLDAPSNVDAKRVSSELGNGISAVDSIFTAVYLAARFCESDFATLLTFTRQCRGDVDTIGAMAGAIWGAANGSTKLPDDLVRGLEGAEQLTSLATKLHTLSLARHDSGRS